MTDTEILAAAEARYQAYRTLLPRIVEDLQGAYGERPDRIGYDNRTRLIVGAARVAAMLATGRDGDGK